MSGIEIRPVAEKLARRVWRSRPGPVSWVLSIVYGLSMDAFNALWTLGLAAPRRARIPVISVGGLTLGGDAKTPVAASVAGHLADAGIRVSVVTGGEADELGVHSQLNPRVVARGGRSRVHLVQQAADEGMEAVVVDSGFQHRRLARDLDVVSLLVDNWRPRRIPAGTARERWAALERADAIVLVRRRAPESAAERFESIVRGAFPGVHVAHVRITPGSVSPVSEGARTVLEPHPRVAVAGVMWPDLFFEDVHDLGYGPEHRLALSDHATPDERTAELIVRLAGADGVICTAKDAGRLKSCLPDHLPLWLVEESLSWGEGGSALLAGIERLVRQDSRGSQDAA